MNRNGKMIGMSVLRVLAPRMWRDGGFDDLDERGGGAVVGGRRERPRRVRTCPRSAQGSGSSASQAM